MRRLFLLLLPLLLFTACTSLEEPVPTAGTTTPDSRPDTKTIPDTKVIPDRKTIPDTKVIPDTKTIPDTKVIPDTKTIPDTKIIPDPETVPDPWENLFDGLSSSEELGQLFMLEVRDPDSGRFLTRLDEEYRRWAYDIQPGGFILFANNMVDPAQTKELIRELTALVKVPPFIGLDEEGGIVSRLNAVPFMGARPQPTARIIGATGKPSEAGAVAREIAAELKKLGFSVDFAPVADVHVPESDGPIGERSYGTDPEIVAAMASSFAMSLEAENIMSVAKHFPGHGAATGDSHKGRAVLEADSALIGQRELIPFRQMVRIHVGGIMLGHITAPALDPDRQPASISRKIATGLLREELGYNGLIFTDSLRMRAVTAYYNAVELPLMAFEAGADILLMPVLPRQSRDLIMQARNEGRLEEGRINSSLARIRKAKQSFLELAPP